jgi:uncharacterized protein
MTKPVPIPTTDTAAFWDGCRREELLYQKCESCGHVQFYPRPFCVACQDGTLAWQKSAGRGVIHTFTVMHRPANRAFDGDVPYVIALVDLAEGFRMMMNVVGANARAAAIGARVRIVFEARGEHKLPQAVLEADA